MPIDTIESRLGVLGLDRGLLPYPTGDIGEGARSFLVNVFYYDYGSIKTSELYHRAPFEIILDIANEQLSAHYFLQFIDSRQYKIAINEEALDTASVHFFDAPLTVNENPIIIKRTKWYQQGRTENKIFGFSINNLDRLAKSYQYRVMVEADPPESSILKFSMIGATSEKDIDYLNTLMDVGLGYIKLGQSATTLSGGEAQRIKLARELAKRNTGDTLYILDEPTTGLHFQDIEMLLTVLQRLVAGGNTVIVIEHNLDVIKTCDWVIDLGPEGGKAGGRVVAQGSPEQVARSKSSYTGFFLNEILK